MQYLRFPTHMMLKRIVGDIGDADGMSASLNNFSIFFVEVVCDQIIFGK